MTPAQEPLAPVVVPSEAMLWAMAKPILEALVKKKPRCIPVLVDLAHNVLKAEEKIS
ncbi:hypothetical protein [Streptomyces sp. NPDC088752]|uniref:hypothetical protein n=1 Tax=Streptomyces sp. NPDC088752 TaxID=3154963 RepID=UPI003414A307